MASVIQQYAAGIVKKEIDQSNTIAAVGTSIGAMVVRAPQGTANRDITISDYPTYINTFGNPVFSGSNTGAASPRYGYGAYAAEEFLNESNELHVVRIVDSTDKYPMVRFTSTFSKTTDWTTSAATTYEGIAAAMTPSDPDTTTRIKVIDDGINAGDKLLVGALGPGVDAENIGVTLDTFNVDCDWLWNYDEYPTASALSSIMSSLTSGGYNDLATLSAAIYSATGETLTDIWPIASQVFKINVHTKNSTQTWSDINTKLDNSTLVLSDLVPVETFYGTIGFEKDGNNAQLRMKDKVNGVSKYIYIATGGSNLPYEVVATSTQIFKLAGGAISNKDGIADNSDLSNILSAWDFFVDREYTTVSILINPDWNISVKQKVNTIATNRMDCIAVGQSGTVTDITVDSVIAQEKYGYKNPSYIALYAGWDLKYDQANDRDLYVPKALYGAALFARVDRTGYTWNAPAGDPNGILTSKGQNKIFKFTDIGLLQKAGINTSRNLRSTGNTMWGQRTAQIKDSALNRINVRRLLIYIENTVEQTLFPFLFNIVNNDRQRLRVTTLIDNFLASVRSGGGITDSQTVCNDQNNTADIIDASQMVIDLFVVPSKPVEVIQINTRIMRTGVSFSETIL